VEYSRQRNQELGKQLELSLVTNLTAMTEELADWLIANDILICTSLDGPPQLHNSNRRWREGADAFATVTRWIGYFNRRCQEMGRDPRLWHVDALLTTTRKTLAQPRAVVDQYVELCIPSIHLRPLNPYGFAVTSWKSIGYSMDEFLDFYLQALDYIVELNLQGVEILEGTAAIFLHKMLTPLDPNFVDIRSPCGAAIGQVTYNYDGKIYPCDEARMVAAMNDEMFCLGRVGDNMLADTLEHPTTRALAVASLLDSLPSCDTCWNKPFCGVCPMYSYMESGDIFGQRPRSAKCKQHLAIARALMTRLAEDTNGKIEAMFRRWTIPRSRQTGEER
jgi:His-Xaa-Ser system radical SAM maturase HxsB